MTVMEERRGKANGGAGGELLRATVTPSGNHQIITVGNHSLKLPAPNQSEPGPAYEMSKRALDVVVSSTLLIVLFPVFMTVALLIFLEDRGDIFYYQTRVGRNGRQFRFFKFRSMVRNADQIKEKLAAQNEAGGTIFKMKNDPRITRIGRFIRRYSVDELPQLVNVLRGDMSLIGPRPHLPVEVERYDERQGDRMKVQPGLLCFREVLGRSNMNFEQWVELDLLYIEHRCWYTDMVILLRAIPAVFSAEGAY